MIKNLFTGLFVLCLFSSNPFIFAQDEKPATVGWHTNGSQIVNPEGNTVILKSVSWFGFETDNKVVHGLWIRNMGEMLDQIKEVGFNSIRVPFSNDILKEDAIPSSINTWANRDLGLEGKSALETFDVFIQEASKRGLYLILDRHRPDSASQSELWYTDAVPETKWIEDWKFIANRYKDNPYVIAFDLHNEPHGSAAWGNGDSKTDWKAAAERARNAVLEVNPDPLIIVEGIANGKSGDAYWWGGALDRVKASPVKLAIPNKVVYSPHDYGYGVYEQPWFEDPSFPNNMDRVWDEKWGYLVKENIAPVWIGEFGGRKTDFESKEGLWQNKLVQYLNQNKISFSYWSWNPNSGDTGGILKDDWTAVHEDKVEMLQPILE